MIQPQLKDIPVRGWWPGLIILEIPAMFAAVLTEWFLSPGTALHGIAGYIFLYSAILVVIGGVWMIVDFIIAVKNGEC